MAIQEEIQDLYDQHGFLTANIVLEAAKDERSALHQRFEWDVRKASYEYNLIQARQLIKTVQVTRDGNEERFVHIPKIVNDGGSQEGYYKPIGAIITQQSEYDLALMEAVRYLEGAQKAVDLLTKKHGKKGARVSRKIESAKEELRAL